MDHTFTYQERAERLRAVADETRIRLLRTLCEGEKYVSELADRLGLAQPTVSHHLAILRRAGLVEARRDGPRVVYALPESLHPPAKEELILDLGCCRIEFKPRPDSD